MDNELRLEYLSSMGIEVWLPRTSVSSISESGSDWELNDSDNWDKLNSDITHCHQCDLCHTRTQSLVGSGSHQAEWLWITEAPSQIEDQDGDTMLGVTGELFTEMLRAINLSKDEVFITHIIKCMTPNNRAPHANELLNCHGYIQRQINLIKPKIMIAVGHVAAQALLNQHAPLSELKNNTHMINNIPLVVINHPAYLLRFLHEKQSAWLDLLNALHIYKEMKGEPCGD